MDTGRYRQAEQQLWGSLGLTPLERTIRLGSTGTSIRVQEVGEGAPTLFVHGAPNSGSAWAPMMPHVAELRCVVIDRPGTGLSESFTVTAENLPRFAATFVANVLDELAIDRAHVVASSFGGHLALRSAAATPERFVRMVQMACPAFAPGMSVPAYMRRVATEGSPSPQDTPPDEATYRLMMRQMGHGKSLDAGRIPQIYFDWRVALEHYTDTMRNDGGMIGSLLAQRDALLLSDELLASVHVQTLFLWGEDDAFGGVEVARRTVEPMPRADLVLLPDCGHLPWLDDPHAIGRATVNFLTTDGGDPR